MSVLNIVDNILKTSIAFDFLWQRKSRHKSDRRWRHWSWLNIFLWFLDWIDWCYIDSLICFVEENHTLNECIDIWDLFKSNRKLFQCSVIDRLHVFDIIVVQLRWVFDDLFDRFLHIGIWFYQSVVVGLLDGVSIWVNFLDIDAFADFGGCCCAGSDELQVSALIGDDNFVLLLIDDGLNVIGNERWWGLNGNWDNFTDWANFALNELSNFLNAISSIISLCQYNWIALNGTINVCCLWVDVINLNVFPFFVWQNSYNCG